MRVTHNETFSVELGGSTVVCQLRVGKESGRQVDQSRRDVEGLIGRDILVVSREGNHRRRHLSLCWNLTLYVSHISETHTAGIPLHEPPMTWSPLVNVPFVAQKLIKLSASLNIRSEEGGHT